MLDELGSLVGQLRAALSGFDPGGLSGDEAVRLAPIPYGIGEIRPVT